jgi:hypothetical protein
MGWVEKPKKKKKETVELSLLDLFRCAVKVVSCHVPRLSGSHDMWDGAAFSLHEKMD